MCIYIYIYIFTLRIPLNPSVPSEEVFRVWFGGWFATSEVTISHIKRPSRYQSWTSGTVRKIIELPSWKHWNRHLYWVATHDSQSPIHWLFYFSLICQLYIYIYIYIWYIYIYICMHMYIWFRYHCIIEVPPVIIHFRGIFPGIFHPARKGFPIHLRCQRRSKDLAGTCRRLRRSRYVVGVAFPRKMVSKWSWNQKTWWIVVDLS